MTGVTAGERRSLWAEVLRWPMRGGMLGAVVLLSLAAAALAALEGGGTFAVRAQRATGQAAVALGVLAVLALYARRAVACSFPVERPVPWLRDEQDATPLARTVGDFVTVCVVAFAPLVLWLATRRALEAPAWLDWVLVAALAGLGGALLPLSYAACFAKGTVLAALPAPVLRMVRAAPHAARIAASTSLAFVELVVLSSFVATTCVRQAPEPAFGGGAFAQAEADGANLPLRIVLFVLRAAAFYAALVSFRVAGLLLRDVPEVREALG